MGEPANPRPQWADSTVEFLAHTFTVSCVVLFLCHFDGARLNCDEERMKTTSLFNKHVSTGAPIIMMLWCERLLGKIFYMIDAVILYGPTDSYCFSFNGATDLARDRDANESNQRHSSG